MKLFLDFEFSVVKIKNKIKLVPFEMGLTVYDGEKIIYHVGKEFPIYFKMKVTSSVRSENGNKAGEVMKLMEPNEFNNNSKEKNISLIYKEIYKEIMKVKKTYEIKEFYSYGSEKDQIILNEISKELPLKPVIIKDIKKELEEVKETYKYWSLDKHIIKRKIELKNKKVKNNEFSLFIKSDGKIKNKSHNALYDSIIASFVYHIYLNNPTLKERVTC